MKSEKRYSVTFPDKKTVKYRYCFLDGTDIYFFNKMPKHQNFFFDTKDDAIDCYLDIQNSAINNGGFIIKTKPKV